MEIIAVFIPIVFLIGLFVSISLNIYFKYKTNTVMSERVPLESLGEWYRSEAKAKALRSRGMALKWGGFFGGLGLGVAIGCIARTIAIYREAAAELRFQDTEPYYVFMIMALGLFCGGLGMIGAYFLERRLDKKNPEKL